MRRNILKSNSALVLIGNSPAWTTGQDSGYLFSLVQNSSLSISPERQNIRQVGSQSYSVSHVNRSPDVNLSIDYILEPYSNNEFLLGFTGGYNTYTPAIQNIQSKNHNFYILMDTEHTRDGFDLFKSSGSYNFSGFNALSVGNCYLNSYSVGFSLNQLPIVSVNLVGSNVRMENVTGNKISIPAINSVSGNNTNSGYLDLSGVYQTITTSGGNGRYDGRTDFNPLVAIPNVSEFTLENLQVGGIGLSSVDNPILQSFNLNIDFERTPFYGLGSNYVYDRKFPYPVVGKVDVTCLVSGISTGILSSLFTNETGYDMEVKYVDFMKSATGFYKIVDATLDSISFSMAVNDTMQFSASFSCQITDTDGFFMKNVYPLNPFSVYGAFA